MELFDCVDDQDNVIGVTNKHEAHQKGFIHRVVAVYVFDRQGRLYVQHHKKSGMMDHSIGGHVAHGEDYDSAARREAHEELGLTIPLQLVTNFYSDETYSGANYRHMFALYTCKVGGDWKFAATDEVEHIEPMKLDDIVDQMNHNPRLFTPGFLNSMEVYIEHTGAGLVLDLAEIRQKGY